MVKLKRLSLKNTSQQGFTLPELIIILVIVAILTGMLFTRGINLNKTVQATACAANQTTLETAQTLFYTDAYLNNNAHYADSFDSLLPFLSKGTMPVCPGQGQYRILPYGKIGCTCPDHTR